MVIDFNWTNYESTNWQAEDIEDRGRVSIRGTLPPGTDIGGMDFLPHHMSSTNYFSVMYFNYLYLILHTVYLTTDYPRKTPSYWLILWHSVPSFSTLVLSRSHPRATSLRILTLAPLTDLHPLFSLWDGTEVQNSSTLPLPPPFSLTQTKNLSQLKLKETFSYVSQSDIWYIWVLMCPESRERGNFLIYIRSFHLVYSFVK